MSFKKILGAPARQTRTLVLSAVVGAGLLSAPLAALAQPATPMHHHLMASMKGETIDQRIATLHSALKITSTEEVQWAAVAQAMRDNETSMQALMAETKAKPHPLSAVEDLRTYERFTQAHVDGLKNLIASFETLYKSMPDTQKALADQVFHKFGAHGAKHA